MRVIPVVPVLCRVRLDRPAKLARLAGNGVALDCNYERNACTHVLHVCVFVCVYVHV
jgi:hypothetical protein